MSAPIQVSGLMNDGMGGLKESLSKFRKHHKEVGDALLNVSGVGTATGGPVDKDEPRPEYRPADHPWPKMLYHAEGKEALAFADDEVEDLIRQGYRSTPYVKPRVAMLDPRAEKVEMLRKNAELQGQVTSQADLLQKALNRLEALENSGPKKK